MIQGISKDRTLERIREHIEGPCVQFTSEKANAVGVIPHERMHQSSGEVIVVVAAPQMTLRFAEVVKCFPRTNYGVSCECWLLEQADCE